MSMADYIIEFERLLSKTKHYCTVMSSDILAYRLLKSANVSEQHEQLARATIKGLTYDQMKEQLKKIFGDQTLSNESVSVKIEPVYETHVEYDTLYGANYRGNTYSRGRLPFN